MQHFPCQNVEIRIIKGHTKGNLGSRGSKNCTDALAFLALTEHTPISIQIRSKFGSVEALMLDNEALEPESKVKKQDCEKKLNIIVTNTNVSRTIKCCGTNEHTQRRGHETVN